jgi:hypothetical protein
MVGPPQCRNWQTCGARQDCPPKRPKSGCVRMARRREGRREKSEVGARSPCVMQFAGRVSRTGHPAPPDAGVPGPPPTPQMDACPERCRQMHIPRHHQGESPGPANASQIAAQCGAMRVTVMAQDHAGQSLWQPCDRRKRIRQPAIVGEQPQHRKRAPLVPTPRLDGARPSDKPCIHVILRRRR